MKDMAERFTYHIAISIVPHRECQTSTGVGALGMDGIGSSARHAWRPISPSLNFCNFSFKRKVNEYRMYDPVMSSFLSVDNYVQSPENSQNFNRYAYCLNNPLKYTDPSGECIITSIIAGAFIGAIVNLAVADANGCLNSGVDLVNAASMGALTEAVGGAAGGAVGGAVSAGLKIGGFWGGAIIGGAGGAVGGAASASVGAWCTGASFGEGIWAGVKGSVVGGATGGLLGGLVRGFSDWLSGYSFSNGIKLIDYNGDGIPLNELYPNKRFNYSEYQENTWGADYRLNSRSVQAYDIWDIDLDIELLTTCSESKYVKQGSYSINIDGTYTNPEGKPSFGYTVQSTSGYTEIHISPYAALHPNEAIFKSVVGHELVHTYHYLDPSLCVSQNGPSERAALSYSKSVYDIYDMTNVSAVLLKEIQSLPWSNAYRIPNVYPFAPIQ